MKLQGSELVPSPTEIDPLAPEHAVAGDSFEEEELGKDENIPGKPDNYVEELDVSRAVARTSIHALGLVPRTLQSLGQPCHPLAEGQVCCRRSHYGRNAG